MAELNWAPVVSSLIRKLQKHGIQPARVNDGEEVHSIPIEGSDLDRRKRAVDLICSVDEAGLGLDYTDAQGNELKTDLILTLCNKANDIVRDYYYLPEYPEFNCILAGTLARFYKQWEHKPVPRRESNG